MYVEYINNFILVYNVLLSCDVIQYDAILFCDFLALIQNPTYVGNILFMIQKEYEKCCKRMKNVYPKEIKNNIYFE